MTDTSDQKDTPAEEPATDPRGEPEPPSEGAEAPPESVRLGLVLTHGDRILLERSTTGEGAVAWSLPSVEVVPGESFGRASVAAETSQLFPLGALPAELSEEARAAFAALAGLDPATVVDGNAGAPGVTAPSRSLPPALPALAGQGEALGTVVHRSAGRLVLVTALVCAGGVAWVSGVTWAIATTRLVKEDVALAAWLVGVGGAVLFGVHVGLGGHNAVKPASQAWRTVLALLLCGVATGLLLLVASWFGGADESRAAFWLWAFGSLTLALALRRADDAVDHVWPYSWRVAAWTAATCASITLVFPPLRDALFSRSGGAGMTESVAPSDDD